MTTIVAVRKHGRTCVVSDSLTVYGNRKEAGTNLIADSSKLFFWENAIIGFAGSATWKHVFLDFLRSQKKLFHPFTHEVLLSSFSTLWRSFRSAYSLESSFNENSYYSPDCRVVVATQENMYELTLHGVLISNKNMLAIGGGFPFAYGAMRALDCSSLNSSDVAMASIRAAAAWDPTTSGPFSGWLISERGEFNEFATGRQATNTKG